MSTVGDLTHLEPGQVIVFGGNRTTTVPEELAASFVAGDRLVVDDATGDLLHIPGATWDGAVAAVDAASAAFDELRRCGDDQITGFFGAFADRLADDALMEGVR
ncbi:MAG: glutamate-5-semialdehyde dehydrogenase, partial [Actinomycetota bacterium]|nr:glutamate-5-semialdehyde dehydrogenase [Actinomycetota bacterium]